MRIKAVYAMNTSNQLRYDFLYQQHLTNITLQGMRPATIDAYSRALRLVAGYFARAPDALDKADLTLNFASLVKTHS